MKHAIVLGTRETALAVTRSLGRRGVPVILSGPSDGIAARSRYCAAACLYPEQQPDGHYWEQLLLGRSTGLDGGVLLATCDEALQFVASHHRALAERYRLDMQAPELHLELLDK